MEQGSNEWLEWRRQGIGASDSAVLLGLDPYGKTPYKLWLEKRTGKATDTESAPGLFQRGHETEAMVRAAIELEDGVDYPPALFEHPTFPFIRASLDGWGPEGASPRGLEIKMVGKDAMGAAVPPHHYCQMQHQMLVTGEDSWLYARHCEGATQRIRIKADPAMQTKILKACWAFWDNVATQNPPPFTDDDWVPSTDVNLDLALRAMQEQTTTAKRAPLRAEVLRIASQLRLGNKLENMVEGSAKGAKITINPARVKFP